MSKPSKLRELPVKCSHTALADPEGLKPHPKNPHTHPKRQLELLKKAVTHTGWRFPVLVSKRSGYVIAGHARRLVAMELGVVVPVDYQEFTSDAEEMEVLLADIRIPELAEIDEDALKSTLAEMKSVTTDMDVTGFDVASLKALLEPGHGVGRRQMSVNAVIQYTIVFDNQSQQEAWFAFLRTLKLKFPQAESIAERVTAFVKEHGAG